MHHPHDGSFLFVALSGSVDADGVIRRRKYAQD